MMVDNFLWHKVSKEEEERIKKEAKQIMDEFAKSLSNIESEMSENFEVKREKQLRDETKASYDKEFRKIFLQNAPSMSDDFIKAEKKKWN